MQQLSWRLSHSVCLIQAAAVHAFVDGNTIEVIFNNQTAITTQVYPKAEGGGVEIFGTGKGVTVELNAWALEEANNL